MGRGKNRFDRRNKAVERYVLIVLKKTVLVLKTVYMYIFFSRGGWIKSALVQCIVTLLSTVRNAKQFFRIARRGNGEETARVVERLGRLPLQSVTIIFSREVKEMYSDSTRAIKCLVHSQTWNSASKNVFLRAQVLGLKVPG